jgi:hypothetical protein
VHANLYCTPGNSRGFNLHFDTHEVFVLQLSGKKQWQVFEPTITLPLEFLPPLHFEDKRARGRRAGEEDFEKYTNGSKLGPLAIEALLEPGDCLYLPRGFVHQADARDEPSVHLTIGIHVFTWLDLLSAALGQVAGQNEDLRRALPVGLFKAGNSSDEFEKEFDERLQLLVRNAVFATAVSELAESLPHSRIDQRGNLEQDGVVDRDTKLEGNGVLRFYLAADGTMAGLACDQKEFWLPVGFAPALRFVTEQKVFSPSDIPGPIGDNGKLAFVRHLVKDGFLRIAQ